MADSKPVLFFRATSSQGGTRRSPDIEVEIWRPSVSAPVPPGGFDPRLLPYSLIHWAGLFGNRSYGALLLRDAKRRVVHRSMIMPPFGRFPFMAPQDLQIGAVETVEGARGQGLAARAISEIVERHAMPGRTFWYLTEATNAASIAAAKRSGFELVGTGEKLPRLGLKFLGYYDITRPLDPDR